LIPLIKKEDAESKDPKGFNSGRWRHEKWVEGIAHLSIEEFFGVVTPVCSCIVGVEEHLNLALPQPEAVETDLPHCI
jgi:hypothetical protein